MTATKDEVATPLAIAIADDAGAVPVAGNVDLAAARDLADALDVLFVQGVRRVDLHLVDALYVESQALERLLEMHQWLARSGGRLRVAPANEAVVEAFRRRGLAGLLR